MTRTEDWHSVEASGSVEATALLIQELLNRRGVAFFGRFDHGSNARKAGLKLADEVIVVFGSPAVGTKLMQDNPDVGYDLPLRILIRNDDGATRVGYRDPATLIDTYGLTVSRPDVEKVAELLSALLKEVARK